MASLEKLVRPFQLQGFSPAQAVPGAAVAPVDNAVLAIGQEGATKTFSGNYRRNVTFYMDAQNKEMTGSDKREVTKKRIENPDDNTQYVEVEVIDKLHTMGPNGQKKTTVYNNKKD